MDDLLERTPQLGSLHTALQSARQGHGRLVFVGGEAGIGKTTLVERFCLGLPREVRIFRGACDAIATPRPLGPLIDMAAELGDAFEGAVRGERRELLFDSFLRVLREGSRPVVVVLEDAHWADDGTLDLLRFLGRRVAATSVLLIVTYRDDELDREHPLRIAMGDLATAAYVGRITVPALSLEGVARLAGLQTVDVEELHRRTGGNPFFVTEVLGAEPDTVPATVLDAVGARAARLAPDGRAALDVLSVVGSGVRLSQLDSLRIPATAVDTCIESGMLEDVDGSLRFRHELVRDAIYRRLTPARRRELHGRVLEVLEGGPSGTDVTILAHHAAAAGDGVAVLRHSPIAARRAAQLGAHKEAYALYRACLPFLDALPEEGRAALLEAYATECTIVDRLTESAEVRNDVAERWRRLGQPLRVGLNLSILAQVLVGLGRDEDANATSTRAVTILEDHEPGRELGRAYWYHAHLRTLDHDVDGAIAWGNRALTLTGGLGDVAMMANAHLSVGRALLQAGRAEGREHFERSIALGLEHDLPNVVASAYGFMGLAECERYLVADAVEHLVESVRLGEVSGHDNLRLYFLAWLALARLRLGDWDGAADAAHVVVDRPQVATESRALALTVLGFLRARREDPDATALLDEAAALLGRSPSLQRLAPLQAARAAAAWIEGDLAPLESEVRGALELAQRRHHTWYSGEFAYWLWKAGVLRETPPDMAEPFALQIAGRSAEAARAWERLGCPYEAARAAAEGGDEVALRAALTTFRELGAGPAAQRVAARLRELGARAIPRGPRAATRSNPAFLTPRELDVLELLAVGLRNAAIAERHGVSTRTVDHQVSSVLAKLEVHSRTEAVARAHELGLLDQDRHDERGT